MKEKEREKEKAREGAREGGGEIERGMEIEPVKESCYKRKKRMIKNVSSRATPVHFNCSQNNPHPR